MKSKVETKEILTARIFFFVHEKCFTIPFFFKYVLLQIFILGRITVNEIYRNIGFRRRETNLRILTYQLKPQS